jgi:hypothetical protein
MTGGSPTPRFFAVWIDAEALAKVGDGELLRFGLARGDFVLLKDGPQTQLLSGTGEGHFPYF